ncbi:hypothetical protein AAG570_008883 [Ranatra chinensis]|uniref:Uncharacterized protein n=1 Tax=Ranatra chinensis TaxID=642074 RepID=A0ABD0YSA7_9HEMI
MSQSVEPSSALLFDKKRKQETMVRDICNQTVYSTRSVNESIFTLGVCCWWKLLVLYLLVASSHQGTSGLKRTPSARGSRDADAAVLRGSLSRGRHLALLTVAYPSWTAIYPGPSPASGPLEDHSGTEHGRGPRRTDCQHRLAEE